MTATLPHTPQRHTTSGVSTSPALAPSDTQVQSFPLELLRPSKTNPRETFDPAFIRALGEDIRKNGVVQSLLVRPHPIEAGAFEIVCGEQRYRAATEVGLAEVPAILRELTNEAAMAIQLCENTKRRNLSALEEAKAFKAFVKRNTPVAEIARQVGQTEAYILDRLNLNGLQDAPRQLLLEGRISTEHAIILARLKPEHQLWAIRRNDGGLWSHQAILPAMDVDDETDAFEDNWYKPNTPVELQAWVDRNIAFTRDDQNLRLFPETREAVAREEKAGVEVVNITYDHAVPPSAKEAGDRILTARSWQRADGSQGTKVCEHSVVGIIAVGPGRGGVLRVCIAKKRCRIHFADDIRAREERKEQAAELAARGVSEAERRAAAKEQAAAAEAKRQAEKAAFERAKPAIWQAFAKRIQAAPLSKLHERLAEALTSGSGEDTFVAQIVPPGRVADSMLRHLMAVLVFGDARWVGLSQLEERSQDYGLDVDVRAIVARAAATAPSDGREVSSKKKPRKAARSSSKAGKKGGRK